MSEHPFCVSHCVEMEEPSNLKHVMQVCPTEVDNISRPFNQANGGAARTNGRGQIYDEGTPEFRTSFPKILPPPRIRV